MLSSFSLPGTDIQGIVLSADSRELRGAVLDMAQILAIARLLGIEITA